MIKNVKKYEDFKRVFKVFEKEPFWEKWTEEDYNEEFNKFIKSGEIFGYFEDDIYGLITILYGEQKKCEIEFNDSEKVIYLSDLAVLSEKRNKGIGNQLVKYLLEYIENMNKYDLIYLRTNLYGSMSENIFTKTGFEIFKDQSNQIITQKVEFERNRLDIPKEDIRKFMVKKFEIRR